MKKNLSFIAGHISILVFLLVQPCFSQDDKNDGVWPECPDLKQFFSDMSSQNKNWPDLYDYFKKYNKNHVGCDDGVYAEGYDDFVVHRLAKHWEQTGELIVLMKSDPQFGEFIIRHISPTADKDELHLLLSNARHSCPRGQDQFCSEAIARAEKSIKMIEEILHHNQGVQQDAAPQRR